MTFVSRLRFAIAAVLLTGAALCAAHTQASPADEPLPVIRVGIIDYVRPSPNEEIMPATVAALERFFGPDRVNARYMSHDVLEAAVRSGTVDVFITSSGFFRRMTAYGARDLVTAASRDYPDPNHNDGAAFVVAADRPELNNLHSLKGGVVVANHQQAFTGWTIPRGELQHSGYDPDKFFSEAIFLGEGAGAEKAPYLLRERRADVAFLRLCFFEQWLERHPEEKGNFRVIHRKDDPAKHEACTRSTDLYPTWTVGTTPATPPMLSRLVTRALLEMPPTGRTGFFWGVATDYSDVDKLFRDTKSGHYAYLRTWTVKRFFEEYRRTIFVTALVVFLLMLHAWRVTVLVKKRTADLQSALAEQKVLQNRERQATARLHGLEKTGVVAQLSVIFAHEMRQPLGAISLYSYALRKLLTSGRLTPEKGQEVIDKLDEQTARANDIVTRVRAYAKGEAPARVSVHLLHEAERAAAELRSTGKAVVPLTVIADADPVVTADPLELELAAVNLMKNALEAAQTGGSAGSVRATVDADERNAILTVSNTGAEVPAEIIRGLTEAFVSSKAEGLGLGLTIVKTIVEGYGGKLVFAPRSGGGLIVRMTIPLKMEDEPAESGTQAEEDNTCIEGER